MIPKQQLHDNPVLRQLVQDRDRLTRQIAGRERTLADVTSAIARGALPHTIAHLERQQAHQQTFLAADRVRLADLTQTIADITTQEDQHHVDELTD